MSSTIRRRAEEPPRFDETGRAPVSSSYWRQIAAYVFAPSPPFARVHTTLLRMLLGLLLLNAPLWLAYFRGFPPRWGWLLLYPVVAVPIVLVFRGIRTRQARLLASLRVSEGALCPACGYDLRGHDSPSPCPECGREWNREADAAWWKKWTNYHHRY